MLPGANLETQNVVDHVLLAESTLQRLVLLISPEALHLFMP